MLTFALITTGVFSRNVSKLFSKLNFVTDNLPLHVNISGGCEVDTAAQQCPRLLQSSLGASTLVRPWNIHATIDSAWIVKKLALWFSAQKFVTWQHPSYRVLCQSCIHVQVSVFRPFLFLSIFQRYSEVLFKALTQLVNILYTTICAYVQHPKLTLN